MEQKLTLFPDTFLWMKKDRILLYNAKSFDIADFMTTAAVRTLCEQLCSYDNLYSVPVNMEASGEDVQNFVTTVVTKNLGVLNALRSPIVSLPPLLNIQNDIERLRKSTDRDTGENVLAYLRTLTIYTGGNCPEKNYSRQIIYPVCSYKVLDAAMIADYLEEISSPYLQTINLVVSDITNPEIIRIGNLLSAYKEKITFYFLYPGSEDEILVAHIIAKAGYKVRFICEVATFNPLSDLKIKENTTDKHNMTPPPAYDLIVKNDKEYEFWMEMTEKYGIEDYQLIPVYDNNGDYFKENVFLTEPEIRESCLSRREVFAHQAINTLFFGTLTVMPDGHIYSDVNTPALGTVKDSIYDVIVREMENNYAWRRIRSTDKCKECVYQWLCPSPTPYEKAMNIECICNTEI